MNIAELLSHLKAENHEPMGKKKCALGLHELWEHQEACEMCDLELRRNTAAVKQNMLKMGLPDEFKTVTSAGYEIRSKEHKKAINLVCDAPNKKLSVLAGNYRTGKTLLGAILLNSQIKKGEYHCAYITAARFSRKFSLSGAENEKIIDEYSGYKMLVIDELRKATMKYKQEEQKAYISEILTERHARGHSTLLISNVACAGDLNDLLEGQAIARISAFYNCKWRGDDE